MLRTLLLSTVTLLAGTAFVANAAPKDDVQSAAKKLADSKNYSWKATTEGGFGGTVDGKTEKDGFTTLTMKFGDNDTEIVKKGDKGAAKTQEGWKSVDELSKAGEEGQFNPERFLAIIIRTNELPPAVAETIVANSKELKKTDDGWSCDLTEDGVKDLLPFGRRQNGPQISNPKGSARIWAKDGVISKIEYKLQGTMNFNNQDNDIDRTTTIEIKDVGTTKVEVPEEAKKKAS